MIYPESFEHKIGFTAVRDAVAAMCVSPLGAALCREMVFSSRYQQVMPALRATAEMLSLVQSDAAIPLHNVRDITPQLRQLSVEGAFLTAAELAQVRKVLCGMGEVYDYFSSRNQTGDDGSVESSCPALWEVVKDMCTFKSHIRLIDSVLDTYGNIKDSASPLLAEIRSQLSSMSGRVNSAMRRVISRAIQEGVLEADVSATVRDGRLVVPVLPMNKRRINGIVHDESASGKTVFIEPAEVVEVNNRIRELQMEERREIIRILTVTAASLRPDVSEMLDSCDVLGKIDFIHAKASYARTVGGTLPVVSRQPEMEWFYACHPVLLETLRRQSKDIVPLDIRLTAEDRILIISGPNAGGKSVCLKTVGIVQYMLQCGMLPPVYENSRMGFFTDIFVDIGDDQSLEDDLSTYSSHLKNMRLFLQRGGKASLMLIDEFGGGTEPQIGGALAQAILKQLNALKMWGVITTHYQNLKHYAEDTDGLVNGSMLYDRHLMQPLFKLSIGNPGSSFALEIARKTGLPAEILSDAESIVGSDYINMDKYLLDIARDKRYWENKRLSIKQKEKKLESTLQRYETDAEELRSKRREILAEARTEAKKIIDGSNAAIERTIREIRTSQADKARTIEARKRLHDEKNNLLSADGSVNESLKKAPKPRKAKITSPKTETEQSPLSVGDIVKLDGEGVPGKIVDIQGHNATVTFGMIKTTVKVDRLRRTMAKIDSGASKAASFISASTSNELRSRQLEFNRDIDVRGMRVDEAVQAITYFIDDAVQFNAGRVRILHGTGTGALRQSIRQYLDTVSGVRDYRDEHVQFGGAGITVVDLE